MIGLLAGWLVAAFSLSASEIYRWVDAQGVTHYGSTPPPGVKATPVDVPPAPPPPVRSPGASAASSGPTAGGSTTATEPPGARASSASAPDTVAARLQRCAHATQQLATVTRGGPVYRYDAAGQRVFLADELRDTEIARWRQTAERECAGLDSAAATRERERQMFDFTRCQEAKETLQRYEQAPTQTTAQDLQQAREAVRNLCSSARFPADTGTHGEWFHQRIVARPAR